MKKREDFRRTQNVERLNRPNSLLFQLNNRRKGSRLSKEEAILFWCKKII
jgi:hypothetical protein